MQPPYRYLSKKQCQARLLRAFAVCRWGLDRRSSRMRNTARSLGIFAAGAREKRNAYQAFGSWVATTRRCKIIRIVNSKLQQRRGGRKGGECECMSSISSVEELTPNHLCTNITVNSFSSSLHFPAVSKHPAVQNNPKNQSRAGVDISIPTPKRHKTAVIINHQSNDRSGAVKLPKPAPLLAMLNF